jgi:hypothetical protein
VIFKITLYNHVPWTYNEKLYKAHNKGRKTANLLDMPLFIKINRIFGRFCGKAGALEGGNTW